MTTLETNIQTPSPNQEDYTTAGRFFNISQAVLMDTLGLLQDKRGKLLQFGVTEEGHATWFEQEDSAPKQIISLEYDASQSHEKYGWRLTFASLEEGVTSYTALVTANSVSATKTVQRPNGVLSKDHETIEDPAPLIATIGAMVQSSEFAAKTKDLHEKKEKAEGYLGMLIVRLGSKGYTAEEIKKQADRAEESVKRAKFGSIGAIATAKQKQTKPVQGQLFQEVFRNFKTGDVIWKVNA